MTVLGSGGQTIVTYESARCTKRRNSFYAYTPRVDGSKLYVTIDDFTGFHDYDMVFGLNADPYAVFVDPSDTRYSNLFKPPFPSPGSGQVNFARQGKLLGVGFSPAYSRDGSDAVTFAGVLNCKYKRR